MRADYSGRPIENTPGPVTKTTCECHGVENCPAKTPPEIIFDTEDLSSPSHE